MCCEYHSWEWYCGSGHIDASGTAVGATLGQKDASGVEHPLAFVSRKLTTTQCRRSTIEREAYAIVWALGRFRDLIFGSRIVIFCDHNPLQYNSDSATKSAKLLRWSLALAELDILRVVRMLWLIICHECEITTLYIVSCKCDSFPVCRTVVVR